MPFVFKTYIFFRIKNVIILSAVVFLSSCASGDKAFMPKSMYPPDPWVKGYSNPNDCLGGESLAAVNFQLPEYPRRAYRSGRQGWVIMRLDVDANGQATNVDVERSVPSDVFESSAIKAVNAWTFKPPNSGTLENCRVLLRFRAGSVTLGG